MINPNKVYDSVSKAIDNMGIGATCNSVVPTSVMTMPYVCIYESDNYTNSSGLTLKCEEKTSISQFTIEVYTKRDGGGMAQAKSIINTCNSKMSANGYYRTMEQIIPNADISLVRIIAKYRRLIGDSEN